jgi:hypothetical protein
MPAKHLLSLFLLAAAPLPATIITYNERGAWIAALGTAVSFTESLNGVAADTSFQSVGFATPNFVLLQQGPSLTGNHVDVPAFSTPGVNGSTFASIYVEGDAPTTVMLTPNSPLRAFGMVQNPHGRGEGIALRLLIEGQAPVVVAPDSQMFGGGGHFFGFLATAGESVYAIQFIANIPDMNPATGQLVSFDDFEGVFAPVSDPPPIVENPEPGTVAMLAGGLLVMERLARRRRD